MEYSRPYQTTVDLLSALRSTSPYLGFRSIVEWLAILGYLALGLYAGAALGFQGFAFGIMTTLSCAVGAAGLHVTTQVILVLVDIADAQVARLEESRR